MNLYFLYFSTFSNLSILELITIFVSSLVFLYYSDESQIILNCEQARKWFFWSCVQGAKEGRRRSLRSEISLDEKDGQEDEIMGTKFIMKTLNEAKIMKNIASPYIVKYFHSFTEKEKFYICMEYCSGGDLSQLLKGQMGKPLN